MAEKQAALNGGGPSGPLMGLDIGTANIVVYRNGDREATVRREANAFFAVLALPNTRKILEDKKIHFIAKDKNLHILGNAAEEFANILRGQTRRPMEDGLVNLREEDGINVIRALLDRLVAPPAREGQKIWFGVPGEPLDRPGSVVFNTSIFESYLKARGFAPRAINEGMAVVVSELADRHATGIGISLGGGMCNVCFAYLSIPAAQPPAAQPGAAPHAGQRVCDP